MSSLRAKREKLQTYKSRGSRKSSVEEWLLQQDAEWTAAKGGLEVEGRMRRLCGRPVPEITERGLLVHTGECRTLGTETRRRVSLSVN